MRSLPMATLISPITAAMVKLQDDLPIDNETYLNVL
jgi:hypothetical protein